MKHVEARWRRRLCRCCGEREAKYRHRGRVGHRRDHELCFRCFRSLCDAARARLGLAA